MLILAFQEWIRRNWGVSIETVTRAQISLPTIKMPYSYTPRTNGNSIVRTQWTWVPFSNIAGYVGSKMLSSSHKWRSTVNTSIPTTMQIKNNRTEPNPFTTESVNKTHLSFWSLNIKLKLNSHVIKIRWEETITGGIGWAKCCSKLASIGVVAGYVYYYSRWRVEGRIGKQ